MQENLNNPSVAVFSDIHGNLEALRVALKVIDSLEITQLLFLGDLLGYYYRASECLRLLQNYQLFSVLGNHEEMYLKLKNGQLDHESIRLKYGSSLHQSVFDFDESIDTFVRHLPLVRDLKFEDTRLRLAHGDFISSANYIYPDSSKSEFEFADLPDIEFVFLGNTHLQMLRVGKWTNIINPGSIGMCRSRINNVQFVTLNLQTKVFSFHNVGYSPVETLADVERIDPECRILQKYIK
jgi:predicted phosphodiesterase